MAGDVNWLLSTTAQSAAALVAIVGGLLVSRVVAMRSDVEALGRRARETDARIEHLEDMVVVLEAELLEEDGQDFMREAYDYCRERLESVDASTVLQVTELPAGRDAEAMEPYARRLIAALQLGHQELWARLGDKGRSLPQSVTGARRAGADLPSGPDDWVFDFLLYDLQKDAAPLGTWMSLPDVAPYIAPAGSVATEVKLEEARAELQTLGAQRALIAEELRDRQDPPDLRGALAALGGLAVLGVVLPIGVMALFAPEPDGLGPWGRAGIFGAFLLGLAGLGAFLMRASKPTSRWPGGRSDKA